MKLGGYILLDDAYLPDEQRILRFRHNYLTKAQWEQMFEKYALTVLACDEVEQKTDPEAYRGELNSIRKRAEELILQYPKNEHYSAAMLRISRQSMRTCRTVALACYGCFKRALLYR